MAETATLPSIAEHGASRLPSVELDSYNIELKDDEGFIGDRASKGAFREIIENWPKSVRKAEKVPVELVPVRHDPDEAGLIGAPHLAPKWLFKGHDAILAVDIGGTNIRVGVVELNLKKAADLSKASVWKFDLWRHGDDKKIDREGAVKK